MDDTDFRETILSRLRRAERFYDGPIPQALRRRIFAPPGPGDPPAAQDLAAWRDRARESARRLRRLKPLQGFTGNAEARRAAERAYRRELDWCRECVAGWRAARLAGVARRAAPGCVTKVATPAGLEPATISLEG
jgi:hypothetical protein